MSDAPTPQPTTTAGIQAAAQPGNAVVPPTIGNPNAPTTPAPDMSNLPGPSGTPEQAILEGNMQGAADQRQQAATEMAKPLPSAPHARLLQMIQGLSAAVAGSGAQWASRGKVNGAEVTNQILAQEAQQRENQQKLAMEQKQQDVQNHLAIGASNEATANMMANLMSLKQKMSESDLQMKGEKIGQIGATQDVRTKALQDYMQTGDLKAYQDTLSQLGNVTAPAGGAPAGGAPAGGAPAGAAAPTGTTGAAPAVGNLPPVAIGQWQNGLDAASLAYPNDPDIKQAAADFKTAQGQAATDPQAASLAMARAARIAQNRMSALDTGVKSRTAQEASDPLYKLESDPTVLAGANSTAAVAQIRGMIASETDPTKLKREQALLGTAQMANTGYMHDQESLAAAKAIATENAQSGGTAGAVAAGMQLQNGTMTLSDLRYASRNQTFIQNALAYAQKGNADPKLGPVFNAKPGFSAAQMDNYRAIARSEDNVKFFGNVNSLTQAGGTIDQLSDVGNTISQHDFKILNKAQNWADVQSGKAPQAGYSSTALGVIDDYAKVMGGGVGSDTSRALVLQAINPDLSPAQRQEAIVQMRKAVNSQAVARAGNNPYLQDYLKTTGESQTGGSAAAPAGTTGKAPASDGKWYYHNAQGQILGPAPAGQ